MKRILLLFLLITALRVSGQPIAPNFIDNFKISKWKSIDNFNDSTILQLKELKLVRFNQAGDSLQRNPVLWIFNDEFKIKYYNNDSVTNDSTSIKEKAGFNTLNCKYTYDKGILTLTLDNKEKSILRFEGGIVSTGSFILLTRIKKK